MEKNKIYLVIHGQYDSDYAETPGNQRRISGTTDLRKMSHDVKKCLTKVYIFIIARSRVDCRSHMSTGYVVCNASTTIIVTSSEITYVVRDG